MLCVALSVKLKEGVGLSNGPFHWACPSDGGLNRGQAASRSSDAADLPPTLVVFSKCGVGKFNPEGDAILFVSGDLWVEKNVQNLNLSKSQNPRVTISKLTQNSCFPSFCNHPV